jgi:predicted transcriptional regulator
MNDNTTVALALNNPNTELAADIVSAYVSNNSLPPSELPALIATIHAALAGLTEASAIGSTVEKVTPAQIRKSIAPDALISFEDGKSYKTLRRHLTIRGLTPEAYRAKWGLPLDYPMTAVGYSAQRSELAKSLGLGQQRKKAAQKAAAPVETVAEPAKATSRKKAADAPAKPARARKPKKAPEAAAAE